MALPDLKVGYIRVGMLHLDLVLDLLGKVRAMCCDMVLVADISNFLHVKQRKRMLLQPQIIFHKVIHQPIHVGSDA